MTVQASSRSSGLLPVLNRVLPPVLIALCLTIGAFSLYLLFTSPGYIAGYDFGIYRDAAARWLAGGSFYLPEQLAGPYTVINGHVLYPPIGLVLFVPFTVLPGFLWWVIPLGIVAWRVVALRPSTWGWVAIAALVCWPYTLEVAYAGNPTIWLAALLALATRWPWVSAWILVKPTLAPFALVGVRTRAWWLALAAFLAACLLFVPMWADWITALRNARGPLVSPLYSVKDLTWMLVPCVAWLSGARGQRIEHET